MKRYITKEQWDELSDKEKQHWKYKVHIEGTGFDTGVVAEIGIASMIEYLGDDLGYMQRASSTSLLWECGNNPKPISMREDKNVLKPMEAWRVSNQPELCDALWEAVKFKIKIVN